MELEQLRFPVGKFEYGKTYNTNETRKHLKDIAGLPDKVKKLCKKLSGDQLDTPYRDGGWTVRQVVHHLADSHINAYVRTKLMLTEANPTIKPYSEEVWAETEDGKNGPIKMSLKILKNIHERWVAFIESLSEEDFHKTYYHPGSNRVFTLAEVLALYSWHGKHHLGHIKIVAGEKKPKKVKKAKIKKVMIVGQVEKKDKEEKKNKTTDTVIIIPAKSLKSDPPPVKINITPKKAAPTPAKTRKTSPNSASKSTKVAPIKKFTKTIVRKQATPAKDPIDNAEADGVQIIPKKRGPKPKEIVVNTATVVTTTETVQKRRGPKPKDKSVNTAPKVTITETIQKKRGPKPKNSIESTVVNPSVTTTSADGRITTTTTTSKIISSKTIVPQSTTNK
jgi:uncharacterized damage-inducible protein DinB